MERQEQPAPSSLLGPGDDAEHPDVPEIDGSLLDLLAPQPGERVLDLGCGPGLHAARICAAGSEVVGIDVDAEMIEQARRNNPRLRFEVADARDFTCAEPYDAVYCKSMLHWIKQPEQVIACVRRALKPGGRFVADFGHRGGLQAIVAAIESATNAVGCGAWESPYFFPSIGQYASLLEQGGFEVMHATHFDRPWPLKGKSGLWLWVQSFDEPLRRVPPDRREPFFRHIEDKLRPHLCRDGEWDTNYFRYLQILALRADGVATVVARGRRDRSRS